MTDALDTIMHEWAIPRMGVRHILVDVFDENEASTKVFLKNGFRLIATYDDHLEIKGTKRGLRILEKKM